ncbi:MAG: hypothetical protein H6977_08600 [Gammaproteobacteria bacterium]|nr:hypothetical protein [Gammaproteobacteria bacterium]MCP5200060.1 hypothetical protein [Gammaproteobacteria bacterium]
MAEDDTSNPISRVTERVVPLDVVKREKSAAVESRLTQVRRALTSLVASAESVPLQHRVNFPVTGVGELRTGSLRQFNLVDEDGEQGRGFTMRYAHVGNQPLKHVTSSEHAHKAVRKTLYAYGLDFRSAGSDTAYRIEVRPLVPAWISVLIAADGKTIDITLNNVSVLGATTYRVAPDHVDRRLVDALVELVTTGARTFYEIVASLPRRR